MSKSSELNGFDSMTFKSLYGRLKVVRALKLSLGALRCQRSRGKESGFRPHQFLFMSRALILLAQ